MSFVSGCGWSQIIDLGKPEQPKPASFWSNIFCGLTKDDMPEIDGRIHDFEQERCVFCSHVYCFGCVKFELVAAWKTATTMTALVKASNKAHLGTVTPQRELLETTNVAYLRWINAWNSSGGSFATLESTRHLPERVTLASMATQLQPPRPPRATYSLFPCAAISISETNQSKFECRSTSSRQDHSTST